MADSNLKEMTTHSSHVPGKSHGQRILGGYIQSVVPQIAGHDWVIKQPQLNFIELGYWGDEGGMSLNCS